MNNFLHRRTIDFLYFEDQVPVFSTNEERDEFHRALGRMVAYDLAQDCGQDTIQLVGLMLARGEILGAYHKKHHPYAPEKLDQKIRDAMEGLISDRPFVMGAVKDSDSDGKFGFHS